MSCVHISGLYIKKNRMFQVPKDQFLPVGRSLCPVKNVHSRIILSLYSAQMLTFLYNITHSSKSQTFWSQGFVKFLTCTEDQESTFVHVDSLLCIFIATEIKTEKSENRLNQFVRNQSTHEMLMFISHVFHEK